MNLKIISKDCFTILVISMILCGQVKNQAAAVSKPAPVSTNAATNVDPDDDSSSSSSTDYCVPELTSSVGLEGIGKPINKPFPLCPNIESSCCSAQDAMTIYEMWVTKNTQGDLKNRFDYYSSIYENMAKTLARVSKFASILDSKITSTNNCKLLAKKITAFKIETILASLKDMHKKYFDFHSSIYKGFFCTICNAENTDHFDITRHTMELTRDFCRSAIVNTLPFLLYYRVHFIKLINLASNFADNCDENGNYAFKKPNEKLFRIHSRRRRVRGLLRCKANVNKVTWFKHCLPTCRHISITSFHRYFRPFIVKYDSISAFLNKRMQILENRALAKVTGGSSPTANATSASNTTNVTATPRMLRERKLKIVNKKGKKNQKHPISRKLQTVSPTPPATAEEVPLPQSSTYYAAYILKNLKKSVFKSEVIPLSIDHDVNLHKFIGIFHYVPQDQDTEILPKFAILGPQSFNNANRTANKTNGTKPVSWGAKIFSSGDKSAASGNKTTDTGASTSSGNKQTSSTTSSANAQNKTKPAKGMDLSANGAAIVFDPKVYEEIKKNVAIEVKKIVPKQGGLTKNIGRYQSLFAMVFLMVFAFKWN